MRRGFCPAGFLPARGNRSSAWAHTRNQPRACETGQRNKHGARLARRRRAAGRLNGPLGRKPPTGKGNARKAKEQSSAFQAFLCVGGCAGAFAPPGKTEAQRGLAPGNNRVRARHGEEKDTVRDLLAAGALLAGLSGPLGRKPPAGKGNARKSQGAELSFFERFCAWGMRRSFFPARENRSRAWACTRNQPRACETRGGKRHGARIARRSRA